MDLTRTFGTGFKTNSQVNNTQNSPATYQGRTITEETKSTTPLEVAVKSESVAQDRGPKRPYQSSSESDEQPKKKFRATTSEPKDSIRNQPEIESTEAEVMCIESEHDYDQETTLLITQTIKQTYELIHMFSNESTNCDYNNISASAPSLLPFASTCIKRANEMNVPELKICAFAIIDEIANSSSKFKSSLLFMMRELKVDISSFIFELHSCLNGSPSDTSIMKFLNFLSTAPEYQECILSNADVVAQIIANATSANSEVAENALITLYQQLTLEPQKLSHTNSVENFFKIANFCCENIDSLKSKFEPISLNRILFNIFNHINSISALPETTRKILIKSAAKALSALMSAPAALLQNSLKIELTQPQVNAENILNNIFTFLTSDDELAKSAMQAIQFFSTIKSYRKKILVTSKLIPTIIQHTKSVNLEISTLAYTTLGALSHGLQNNTNFFPGQKQIIDEAIRALENTEDKQSILWGCRYIQQVAAIAKQIPTLKLPFTRLVAALNSILESSTDKEVLQAAIKTLSVLWMDAKSVAILAKFINSDDEQIALTAAQAVNVIIKENPALAPETNCIEVSKILSWLNGSDSKQMAAAHILSLISQKQFPQSKEIISGIINSDHINKLKEIFRCTSDRATILRIAKFFLNAINSQSIKLNFSTQELSDLIDNYTSTSVKPGEAGLPFLYFLVSMLKNKQVIAGDSSYFPLLSKIESITSINSYDKKLLLDYYFTFFELHNSSDDTEYLLNKIIPLVTLKDIPIIQSLDTICTVVQALGQSGIAEHSRSISQLLPYLLQSLSVNNNEAIKKLAIIFNSLRECSAIQEQLPALLKEKNIHKYFYDSQTDIQVIAILTNLLTINAPKIAFDIVENTFIKMTEHLLKLYYEKSEPASVLRTVKYLTSLTARPEAKPLNASTLFHSLFPFWGFDVNTLKLVVDLQVKLKANCVVNVQGTENEAITKIYLSTLKNYHSVMPQDLLSTIINLYFQSFKSDAQSYKFPHIVKSEIAPQHSSLRSHVSLQDLQIDTVGESIACHKLIAFGSAHIKKVIEADNMTVGKSVIDLKEYDAQTLNEIVTFLYDAKCSIVSVDHAIKLFKAATALGIPALPDTCKAFLYDHKMILGHLLSTGCQLEEVNQYLEWLINN